MEDILLYFSLKYHGQFDLIYKALERKERVDESLKKELLRQLSVLIRLLLVMIIHSILSSSTVLHLCSIIMDLYHC